MERPISAELLQALLSLLLGAGTGLVYDFLRELRRAGGRLAAVHRYALQADRAFFQLLEGETAPALEALDSRELKAFCRQMKGSPKYSVRLSTRFWAICARLSCTQVASA